MNEHEKDYVLLAVGLVLVAVPLGFVVVFPDRASDASLYLRLIASLGGALVGSAIPGLLQIQFPGVRAAGALAVLVLFWQTNPPRLLDRAISDPTFPPPFSEVRRAELRVSEVDDYLRLSVNGTEFPRIEFGQNPDPISILHLLRRGVNTISIAIDNGQYGGCAAKVAVWLNGRTSSEFEWEWHMASPPNVNCTSLNKSLLLSRIDMEPTRSLSTGSLLEVAARI